MGNDVSLSLGVLPAEALISQAKEGTRVPTLFSMVIFANVDRFPVAVSGGTQYSLEISGGGQMTPLLSFGGAYNPSFLVASIFMIGREGLQDGNLPKALICTAQGVNGYTETGLMFGETVSVIGGIYPIGQKIATAINPDAEYAAMSAGQRILLGLNPGFRIEVAL